MVTGFSWRLASLISNVVSTTIKLKSILFLILQMYWKKNSDKNPLYSAGCSFPCQKLKGRVELLLTANIWPVHFSFPFCPCGKAYGVTIAIAWMKMLFSSHVWRVALLSVCRNILWQCLELICCFKDYLLLQTPTSRCWFFWPASPFGLYFYCWCFIFLFFLVWLTWSLL